MTIFYFYGVLFIISMRDKLKLKYPDFSCHPDASCLIKTMKDSHIQQLDCIISGLPFFNFERELRDTLVEQIVQSCLLTFPLHSSTSAVQGELL